MNQPTPQATPAPPVIGTKGKTPRTHAVRAGASPRARHAAGSASLDRLETSSSEHLEAMRRLYADTPFTVSRVQSLLHGASNVQRERVLAATRNFTTEQEFRRWRRMLYCRAVPWVAISADGRTSLELKTCKSRWCSKCSLVRSRNARAAAETALASWSSARLLTLTMQRSNEPLRTCLGKLRTCWRKLRSSDLFKRNVRGGLYSIEVTRGAKGEHWHVHIHALVTGNYIEQRKLSALWLEITGDSMIVDIRAVHDRAAAARYVTKYVLKPTDFVRWSDAAIAEYVSTMNAVRLFTTFGCAHGRSSSNKHENADRVALVGPSKVAATSRGGLAPLAVILKKAQAGDVPACKVIYRLIMHNPQLAALSSLFGKPPSLGQSEGLAASESETIETCYRCFREQLEQSKKPRKHAKEKKKTEQANTKLLPFSEHYGDAGAFPEKT